MAGEHEARKSIAVLSYVGDWRSKIGLAHKRRRINATQQVVEN